MELSNTLPNTVVNILPKQIDDVQLKNVEYFYQYLIDLGHILIWLISFGVLVVLPIIELVIGIVYFNQCSMNIFIPIYLIVAGLISSIILIFVILTRIFIYPLLDDFKLKTMKSLFINAGMACQIVFIVAIFFLLFAVGWFLTGNVWIFRIHSTVQYTNFIESPRTYCNRVVYLTGFGSILMKYSFFWILICRLNCYLCIDIENLLKEV